MNKLINKSLFLVLVFTCTLFLTSCYNNGDVSDKIDKNHNVTRLINGKATTKAPSVKKANGKLAVYYGYIKEPKISKVSYIDYDKFFLKKGEKQVKTGRYANKTKDGKVSWNDEKKKSEKSKEKKNYKKADVPKILLDGKPIKLPCKIGDIIKEYAIFDKVDFSKVKVGEKNMVNDVIENLNNGTKLNIFFLNNTVYETSIYSKYNELLLGLGINKDDDKVYRISTSELIHAFEPTLSKLKLSINGITVGNTLNEMYEKLGEPQIILNLPNDIIVFYIYDLDYEKKLKIGFRHKNILYEYRNGKEKRVKNNVITDISVELK